MKFNVYVIISQRTPLHSRNSLPLHVPKFTAPSRQSNPHPYNYSPRASLHQSVFTFIHFFPRPEQQPVELEIEPQTFISLPPLHRSILYLSSAAHPLFSNKTWRSQRDTGMERKKKKLRGNPIVVRPRALAGKKVITRRERERERAPLA